MGFKISSLWKAPEVNPINNKARSIPFLNPFNMYGRVFFFSWWGFSVGTWAWYAFPPLTTVTIKKDLNLTQVDIANANILALTATCVVRATAGSACDRFGPRWTYVVLLIAGAVPTALAGTVTSFKGLIAIRCFIGILGGCLVPCEVWTTGFFDKNVVGTATAFAAGWGNAGGGITYFAMPAIFDSLVHRQHMSEHTAWRVAFIVPFILIVITAILMVFTCPDTPTGNWNARRRAIDQQMARRDMFMSTVKHREAVDTTAIDLQPIADDKPRFRASGVKDDGEAGSHEQGLLEAASWELVEPPTLQRSWNAVFSLPTFAILAPYFCSFGTELAIISFLGAYYHKQFPGLSQTSSGNWASMVGLLNFFTRPAGGVISDVIYRHTGSLWGKKMLIHALGLGLGIFLLIIGLLNPESKALMFGLMVGFSFFSEASNGAGFALVPHVHPSSNGVISGLTGASGSFGGVIFSLVARYSHTNYSKTIWIMGVVTLVNNLVVIWIPPIPKGQLGGL